MPKIYPPLFKTNKRGKEITWHIRIYVDDTGKVSLLIERGITDGKLVQDKVPITGKGGRTNIEQAELEANARFLKKTRENYREKDGSQELWLKPYLLMQYNKKADKLQFPAYIQPKLDGVRSLFGFVKDSTTKKYVLKFISRRCIEFPNKLKHIKIDYAKSNLPKSKKIFFDGEIYVHDPTIKESDINGIINTAPNSSTWNDEKKKQTKRLQFHVFDYFDLDKLDLPFETRYNNLIEMFKNVSTTSIVLVPQEQVNNHDEIKKITNRYLKNGYEGSVVRNRDFKYNIKGDRLCDALKIKESHDEEFKIVDADKSVHDEVIWILEMYDNNGNKTTFRAPHTGTKDKPITRGERQQLYKDRKKYFGKMATVVYQEKTVYGKPRHGRVIKIRML